MNFKKFSSDFAVWCLENESHVLNIGTKLNKKKAETVFLHYFLRFLKFQISAVKWTWLFPYKLYNINIHLYFIMSYCFWNNHSKTNQCYPFAVYIKITPYFSMFKKCSVIMKSCYHLCLGQVINYLHEINGFWQCILNDYLNFL